MKLSIITINYNNGRGLETTLASLPWGMDDFESIVVDGGSSDDSLDIAQSYVERGARVISEPDEGVYDALNKGIRMAKGEFLSFMNSGDSFLPAIFPGVLNHLKGRAVFYGDRLHGPNRVLTEYPKDLRVLHLFMGMRSLCHQTMFTPKVLFDELGEYDVSLSIVADWAWILKAMTTPGIQFLHLGQVVCHYEGGGLSSFGTPMHDVAEQEKMSHMKLHFPHAFEDWLDFARLYQKEEERSSSGIHRLADKLFRLKNGDRD